MAVLLSVITALEDTGLAAYTRLSRSMSERFPGVLHRGAFLLWTPDSIHFAGVCFSGSSTKSHFYVHIFHNVLIFDPEDPKLVTLEAGDRLAVDRNDLHSFATPADQLVQSAWLEPEIALFYFQTCDALTAFEVQYRWVPERWPGAENTKSWINSTFRSAVLTGHFEVAHELIVSGRRLIAKYGVSWAWDREMKEDFDQAEREGLESLVQKYRDSCQMKMNALGMQPIPLATI